MRNEMRDAFTSASFAPYGLDERWSGTRWLAGSGASDGTVTRLVLAHGETPFERSSTQIRVEVSIAPRVLADDAQNLAIARATTTRELVNKFWLTTGTLDPAVRSAAYTSEGAQSDLTAPWDTVQLEVDGIALEFQMLGDDNYWLAQSVLDQVVLVVDARVWPVASTGLVTITDLTLYAEGSEEIAARGRERFTEE